ncbi:MAG: hypothetical protein KA444_05260 [Bacteroidia bacterium]|nr:hypothetical protein [Bacteroidia bacterium]
MIKLLSIFISASSLFILTFIAGPDPEVFVKAEAPSNASAGSEFTVKLSIHKGNSFGFARIQQFLPEGFLVEVIESKGAQFIEDGQSIKFIWTQMPVEESFEISYKIRVNDGMKGLQAINGVLIYIQDEKTEQYALPPIEIQINAAGTVSEDKARPQVERTLTATVPELNEYKVELKIRPKLDEITAKFIDRIPEGYEAEVVNAHGAEFLFADGQVSFTWPKMPDDSVFTISYLVRSAQRRTPPSINGMLVYGNSAMNMELDSIDKNDALYEQALKSADTTVDNILEELVAAEAEKSQQTQTADNAKDTKLMIPLAKPGIYFKVQISATMRSPVRDNDWFKKYYKLNEIVDLTYHEGWKKYLIGTFDNFKDANLHKRRTREKVSDAFVVAYQDGQRITVKEAMSEKVSTQ